MEEQKCEKDNQEIEELLEETAEQTEADRSQAKTPVRQKNYTLWILAGMYLIYTGYQLCRDMLRGVEGGHWAFFVVGAIFAVIGAGALLVSARGMFATMKAGKAAETQQEVRTQSIPEPSGKMSIRERAGLVGKIDDEEQ